MFLDEAGKEFRVVLHLALFSFQALNLLFYHVQCALWGSYKHREVSYLLITVFTQKDWGLLLCVWDFLLILFSCVSVTIQILVCEADLCMETQKTTSLPLAWISAKLLGERCMQ